MTTSVRGHRRARRRDLERVQEALAAATRAVRTRMGSPRARATTCADPVTETDLAVDALLRRRLGCRGEGWLSEQTPDSSRRLACERVWVVDPLDGTREFIDGRPEFAVSIALVEGGEPVVGGICNPSTGETVLGGIGLGVWLNGEPVSVRRTARLEHADVLASRSEVRRGEWARYRDAPFRLRPMGSVAWKLALVAAGRADATWTLRPKHEWDVAAGVALVRAGGGDVCLPDGQTPTFNRSHTLLPGLLAGPAALLAEVVEWWT